MTSEEAIKKIQAAESNKEAEELLEEYVIQSERSRRHHRGDRGQGGGGMSGCELSHCNYYVNGKCTSEADFVDCETGEDMCYRNSRAIPREEYDKQHTKERPDA